MKRQPAPEQHYRGLGMPETVNVRKVVAQHFHKESMADGSKEDNGPTTSPADGWN